MTRLPEIARATALRHGMLPDDAVVVAMVSGGADSVALLRLLASGELGPVALSVLHVNHCLRGEDSDEDERFVAALCEACGVPCTCVRYDVAAYADAEGLNLEDAGRRVRYRFAEAELDRRCTEGLASRESGRIAVAHTFDDRLETLLARLVTGAGAGGLASIPVVRGRIVRPLLDSARADVRTYLRDLGQEWREDVSNTDTSRQRAWVRHELLPVIEAHNPAFRTVAARTLDILGEEDSLLAELSGAFAHDFARMEEGALVLDRALMGTLSRPMARRTLREALVSAFPEASRIGLEHVDAVVRGMAEDGFARDLPEGLRAEVEYARLRISRREESTPSVLPGLLPLPGSVDLGDAGRMDVSESGPQGLPGSADRALIDADAVSWPLSVDGVRDGDRMRPLGMAGTKKVGDLLTDEKVPRRKRAAVPVVRDGARVVWVAGVRLAEDVRVRPDTTRIAELRWTRPEAEPGEGLDERES